GRPAAFRQLRVRRAGPLHILDDPGLVAASIRHGFYCGLQNAVFRARVFDGHRFQAAYRNEAEDRLFVTRALTRGHRFGYLTDVHVIYHIHDANSSGAGGGRQDVDRRLRVMRPIAQGYADLRHEASFTKDEIRAIDERLHLELFWHIGYALLWANGRRAEAIETYRQALKVWPWSAASWKTYVLARLRTFGQPEAAAPRTRLAYLKALSRYLRLVRQHPGRWRLALQSVALAPLLREHLPPQVIRVHEGFRMRVDGSSQTSRILYATGEYEPATSALIKSKIGQGDLVVDVGANIGYFTLLASSAVGASGAVMAFEPNVVVRERLTDNIRLNASNNVTVHGEALGPTPGEVTFYVGPSNDTGLASLRALDGSATVTVPQVRFDDLPRPGGRPVRLIKVDVEGAELSVIEGMSACLARDRPDIIMEVTDEYLRGLGASAAALFEHLHSLGYRMYEITESGPLKPIASADAIAGCPSQFNAFWTADLRH
ncbi:MAG: FkbM family methyltransferase, partial [Vicinamibacterales bacterium]